MNTESWEGGKSKSKKPKKSINMTNDNIYMLFLKINKKLTDIYGKELLTLTDKKNTNNKATCP